MDQHDEARNASEAGPRAAIARARAGDADAFRVLYDAHVDSAFLLARRLAGARGELAEEAVQDAFIRAFRALGSFRQDASFGTWLRQILVSCMVDLQRRAQRTDRRYAPLEVAAALPARAVGMEIDLKEAVGTAVDQLPDTHRVVLIMHDLEGYSHREIAEWLKTPAGTVRRQLVEARARVRVALEARGHHAT